MSIKFLTVLFLTSIVMLGQVNDAHSEISQRLVLNNLNSHIIEIVELVYSENKEIKQNTILILNVDVNPRKIKVTVLEKDLLKWYSKDVYRKMKGICNINNIEILVYGEGYSYYFKKTENKVDVSGLCFGEGEEGNKKALKPMFRPIIDPIVWVFFVDVDGFELERKDILNPF